MSNPNYKDNPVKIVIYVPYATTIDGGSAENAGRILLLQIRHSQHPCRLSFFCLPAVIGAQLLLRLLKSLLLVLCIYGIHAKKKIRAEAYEIVREPEPLEKMNIASLAFAKGPNGCLVELIQKPPKQ